MARLNSRASVLAALELPAEGPPAQAYGGPQPPESMSAEYRADARYAARPDAARTAPGAPVTGTGPTVTGRRPGQEIWNSARRQAEFYAAYAEMLEADRRPRDAGEAWVQETYPAGQWVGPAALATSYRRAAQHAALVDAAWSTRLAVRAAMAYVAAGVPFGLFLLTGLLDDETLRDSAAVRDVVEPFRAPAATSSVRHPVQLTYLLLAAASRPWLRRPLEQVLTGAEQRLSANARYPIGPQGIPIGEYVGLANSLRYADQPAGRPSGPGSIRDIAARLAEMHRAQAASLRAAQRNRYLWQRGASRVSVVDLEHVAVSGLALRHRPWFDELSEAVTAELARDDELAQLPIWTIESFDTELPTIASSVSDIMRDPDRAWRSSDFREPETEMDPWETEQATGSGDEERGTRAGEETRRDHPGFGDDAGTRLITRALPPPEHGGPPPEYGGPPPEYGGPLQGYGRPAQEDGTDEEDGGDDPYRAE